jgi:hypothetical protein
MHAEARHRVRVVLHHHPLRLDARGVAAELAPADEELLLGGEAVDVASGPCPPRDFR